jgi:RecJ-like exonuclease
MFGISLKGKSTMKCGVCKGEGHTYAGGSIRTCRNCYGKGYVDTVESAQKALRRFSQPRIYTVSHENSTMLVYRGYVYDEVLMALQVLSISGIKAQIEFSI